MTLDDRIQKDLTELYNGGNTPGDIQDALGLNGLILARSGQILFATRALPQYYIGNRNAQTVMVMLNPGKDVYEANQGLVCDICRHSMKNASDISGFHNWSVNYGFLDKNRFDNFDLKQAFFLHKWKDTGVNFPKGFCSNLKNIIQPDKQILLDAKENVLTQKLQLELIPYASSSFGKFNKNNMKLVLPFVDTLLEEIFSQERKYVIFCSKKFDDVFKAYNTQHPGVVTCIKTASAPISGSKIIGSCTVINIHYNNKTIRAIIANTFPSFALPNAYSLMEAYGDYCYNQFISTP